MTNLLSQLLTSIIQVLLFSVITVLWWLIFYRKKQNYFNWIGLKSIKTTNRKNCIRYAAIACTLFMALSLLVLYLLKGVETATSEFTGQGIKGLLPSLIYAFIKTSLSEEILFRGFLLKRLASTMGFAVANSIQSVLFAMLHGIMFFNYVNPIRAVLIIVFTGSIAWFMGYINEKEADGSIIPSWIIHGLSNAFASAISLFSLI